MLIPPDTNRLRFRKLVENDDQLICEMFADDYACRFYPDADIDFARRWIKKTLDRYRNEGHGLWGLELKDSGEFVGDCGLTIQQVDSKPELEIGYHIVLKHRRKGYATEAAKACLVHAFKHTDHERVISLVHKENVASQKVAEQVHKLRSETVRFGNPHWVYYTERSGIDDESQ